jgi:hypothetical protein
VHALGVIELQRSRQRVEHALRDAARIATLEPRVVGDADAGEDRDFLASQAGNPARAISVEPGLLGRDPAPAGGQELLDLAARIHVQKSLDPVGGGWETLPVPLSTGSLTSRAGLLS